MRLSISVMAVPKREEWVQELQSQLGGVPVVWDRGEGLTQNCLNAWRLFDPSADYHVVLQDDAVLCARFREKAESLLDRLPAPSPVSFYCGVRRKEVLTRHQDEAGEFLLGELRWGVAVCLPVRLVPSFLEYFQTRRERQDDARIKLFLRSRKLVVRYPQPCLVNHRPGSSLVGDPGKFRVARSFDTSP